MHDCVCVGLCSIATTKHIIHDTEFQVYLPTRRLDIFQTSSHPYVSLHANLWLSETWRSNSTLQIYDHSLSHKFPPPSPHHHDRTVVQKAATIVSIPWVDNISYIPNAHIPNHVFIMNRSTLPLTVFTTFSFNPFQS